MMYIVIKTGYEGIEEMCYLSDDKTTIVQKMRDIIEDGWMEEERDDPGWFSKQEYADFYCIQKWDGERFDCACAELGVESSKEMLR
jgi:hypothetical protein